MATEKNLSYSVREINPENRVDVKAVAQLHLKLIGRGEIAQLGRLFLERFCYKTLIRDGLIKVFLFCMNGEPVGFITLTLYSITLHRQAIRKHILSLMFLLAQSIVLWPRVLWSLGKAIRLVLTRHRETNHASEPAAEILAIGVLPECRTPRFIQQTGVRIADELFMRAASYFRNLGLDKMRIFYYAFQKETLLFYLNLGGRIELRKQDGRSLYHISFDLNRINK